VTGGDIVAHLAAFAGELRRTGVAVGLKEEIDGVEALTLIDLLDREEVAIGLRSAFRIRPDDRAQFDALFGEWWDGRKVPRKLVDTDRPQDHSSATRGSDSARQRPVPVPRDPGTDELREGEGNPGYSDRVLLRRKPFDEYKGDDLRAMVELMRRLKLRLATRRSRRLVATAKRGVVDLRRSLRRATGTGGDLVRLAWRTRPVEEPRLVLLCDTSGSMDSYTRFLLSFVLSLSRVTRRAEVFAFNTELTRLTGLLKGGDVFRILDRIADGVPDWSGGTRIGGCLTDFVGRFQRSLVDGRTVVIILSDGLDCGEPGELEQAMRSIRKAARRVIWLNPLMGDSRYRPLARGMAAALPYIDHFESAHNLESLERIVPLLAA
jgi:uncharacterized protein